MGVVVCDPTVEFAGVQTYQTDLPVCAGSCIYVPLTFVGTGSDQPLHVCVSYRNMSGGVTRECAAVPATGDLQTTVRNLVLDATGQLPDARDTAQAVRDFLEQDAGGVVSGVLGVVCADWAHCS